MTTKNKLALLAFCALALLACGGSAPPAAASPPRACPYEDLSTWQGGESAWPNGSALWLTYATGCEGKAVSATVASGNPESVLRLHRALELPPDGFVRMLATLELLDGSAAMRIEVRDLVAPWSVSARPNAQSIAEIKTWIPSGHGELVIYAQPLVDGSTAVAMISNVIVETR